MTKSQRATGANAALFLLTDGCPNIEPPRGHLPTLEKLKKKTNFTCTVNTFGFGYSLDSKLLEDIATLGNAGSYAFIPDGSFVGTIFVNAVTTLLATAATNVHVNFNILLGDYIYIYILHCFRYVSMDSLLNRRIIHDGIQRGTPIKVQILTWV